MKKILLLIFFLLVLTSLRAYEQEVLVYKTVDTLKMELTVIYPENASKKNPAAVFFFGGGWASGKIEQFRPQAQMLASKGITCFLVDYRVSSRHKTSPDKCVEDAKSAMRFVRGNAKKFKIDPNRIIASGGSAGGHLAAATYFVEGFNDVNDNLKISEKPNALVLFNPVADNSPEGYHPGLLKRLPVDWSEFSPVHQIKKTAPPTIFMVGDMDTISTAASAKKYKARYDEIGAYCDLRIYEGCKHGFFNYNAKNTKFFDLTMGHVLSFLEKIGYIK